MKVVLVAVVMNIVMLDAQSANPEFARLCAICHGGDAAGTDRGPALVSNRGLRLRTENDVRKIIRNGLAGMPPFPLPANELNALAAYVRSLNATAYELQPAGDATAGERFFFGKGGCASCHAALGRGKTVGSDLSNVGRQLTLAELEQSLKDPGARLAPGYAIVSVRTKDSQTLRGFARAQGNHDLQLQTPDARLHLLLDTEYQSISKERGSLMPPLRATPGEERDLVAYLSRLGGVSPGPLRHEPEQIDPASSDRILHPRSGEWPTYYGSVSGNRHSALDQINTQNVKQLQLAWSYSIPYFGIETIPIVSDGVMYVTGPNQVYALDCRTGREIWRYMRPRIPAGTIAADAAIGANRGVALLSDRVFYITDSAHLLCLNRLTGALQWEVFLGEEPQHYGGTSAPLDVGDEGIRGFVGASQGNPMPWEGYEVRFRFEAFNFPNHPSFGFPNVNLLASFFGRISDTATAMREMQFGLKYVF